MMTKDGELVLIHDETLDRMTDGRGRVPDAFGRAETARRRRLVRPRFMANHSNLSRDRRFARRTGSLCKHRSQAGEGLRETGQAVGAFLRDEWLPGLSADNFQLLDEALGAVGEVAPSSARLSRWPYRQTGPKS